MQDPQHDAKPRILVVEDEAVVRKILVAALKATGAYEVLEAEDGLAARELLAARPAAAPVDVVVTDVMMPRMDGLALMEWAREHVSETTFIIRSGVDTFDTALKALHLGAFDFVSKAGQSNQELVVTVRNAVAQRRLVQDRQRLTTELAAKNERLREQVVQLERVVRLLNEQAEIIRNDLRRAERIQRVLLPCGAPEVEGLSFAGVYRPSHNVGGDFYDIQRLDSRYVAIMMADAAGHGVSAAMLTVLFKHRLNLRLEGKRPRPPSDVLCRVNRALFQECAGSGLFVTAVYGLLDTKTRELVLASAGHTPVAFQAQGKLHFVERTGPALGVERDAVFSERHLWLREGDRLLLYTDGLDDPDRTRCPLASELVARELLEGDRQGYDALMHLLKTAGGEPDGECEAGLEDDVTMLLISATEGPSVLDNGQDRAECAVLTSANHAAVQKGRADGATYLTVAGRGTWVLADAFRDEAMAALEEGDALVVDLSECNYLDSTFLGTLQEIVSRGDERGQSVRLQGVSAPIRRLFDELFMGRVVAHVSQSVRPLPEGLERLDEHRESSERMQRRILDAHQRLASLSDRNREQFAQVIDALRAELDGEPGAKGDRQ